MLPTERFLTQELRAQLPAEPVPTEQLPAPPLEPAQLPVARHAASWGRLLGNADPKTLEILERRRAAARRRGWLVARMLVVADVAGLALAFLLSQLVWSGSPAAPGQVTGPDELAVFAITLPVWVAAAKVYGLYDNDDERTDHSTADDLIRVFHLITVGTWLLFILSSAFGFFQPELGRLVVFWFLGTVLISLFRSCARAFCRRRITYQQNTIIVGAGSVGQFVARKLQSHTEYGVNLVGFADADPKELGPELAAMPVLGSVEDLPALVRLFDIERVIFAFSRETESEMLEHAAAIRLLDVQVDIVPRLYETVGPNATIHTIEGLPLLGLSPAVPTRSSLAVKRMIDMTASAAGLIVLSPLLGVIALAIKWDSRGPVFYRQERVGRDGKPFRLLKFRSMHLDQCRGEAYGGQTAEEEFQRLMSDPGRQREFELTFKLHGDPRVTRVGRILRGTSLDEIPQLFNVLRGHMSLVGPRPITEAEVVRYGGKAASLLAVKPGMTGYWQINGRSSLDYGDRVRLDSTYVASWSLRLDWQILAKTVRVLLSRSGAF
jgi:exopolysaccharide biosynthesis polyprenyl glycosylphosphotransferase